MTAPATGSPEDQRWMRTALTLASRGLGRVWPNPAVGCVLVRQGVVVGRGWTQPGGRPHAETQALAQAGDAARGATAYVSLEPCSHHGRTPPCAEALMAAGIARCVAACQDPDPRVSGRGLAALAAAGVAVQAGVLAAEAQFLNEGFFRRIEDGRPLLTLKLATSLDGRIATHSGESRWITGPASRAAAHALRAHHDAVMVGIGTALADDPDLTCRLSGLEDRSPVRIVADSRLQLPLTSRLVSSAAQVPVWVACREDADPLRRHAMADCGVTILPLPADLAGMVAPEALLAELGRRGLTRVLVEGGGRLAASLLRKTLVDRLEWFRAPLLLGGDGIPAVAAFGVDALEQAPRFDNRGVRRRDADVQESLVFSAP